MATNYYKLLGVSAEFSKQELRTAYKKAMLKVHPDVVGDTPEANEMAAEINLAFSTLSDNDKRRKYDTRYPQFREEVSQDNWATGAAPQPQRAPGERYVPPPPKGRTIYGSGTSPQTRNGGIDWGAMDNAARAARWREKADREPSIRTNAWGFEESPYQTKNSPPRGKGVDWAEWDAKKQDRQHKAYEAFRDREARARLRVSQNFNSEDEWWKDDTVIIRYISHGALCLSCGMALFMTNQLNPHVHYYEDPLFYFLLLPVVLLALKFLSMIEEEFFEAKFFRKLTDTHHAIFSVGLLSLYIAYVCLQN